MPPPHQRFHACNPVVWHSHDLRIPPLIGPASPGRLADPSSVGRELVRPELSPELPDLVASLLALRVGGEHVIIAPVLEHFEDFDGGLLEESDGCEVLPVFAA